MAKSTRSRPGQDKAELNTKDAKQAEGWFRSKPDEWSTVIATRAALRAIPLVWSAEDFSQFALSMFRAAAIARFGVRYPKRSADIIVAARDAVAEYATVADSDAGFCAVASSAAASTIIAENKTQRGAAAARAIILSGSSDRHTAASRYDAQQLYDGLSTPHQLATSPLWLVPAPLDMPEEWRGLREQLSLLGSHWAIWTLWYEGMRDPADTEYVEAWHAAFTDIPRRLPWGEGAEAVNEEIARRLEAIRRAPTATIPDQSPAPVRVEERGGKISKSTDRDSPLLASERDFSAWRDPVVEHIDELSSGDFRAGTNHGRVRDRLTTLGQLLPGEIADVKERQFRIGYDIERFEGLLAAYRSGGDDMPSLNAAQLEDLERLRVALRMGVDKLERWSEFRRQANESPAREGEADGQAVADTLDEMAAVMEQSPEYFHPEMPESFRFLAEAARDPRGATKTVVYGAIKSAENLLSFLGQRALGIGKKGTEAVEAHISKAVAATLVTGFSGAALQLSGVLPQGWAWLKPLLTALGVGG